ncbi:hypothetical protein T484DRAFT_1891637, partial [Baffinella frigidus]
MHAGAAAQARRASECARIGTRTGGKEGMQPGAKMGVGTRGSASELRRRPNPECSCLSAYAARTAAPSAGEQRHGDAVPAAEAEAEQVASPEEVKNDVTVEVSGGEAAEAEPEEASGAAGDEEAPGDEVAEGADQEAEAPAEPKAPVDPDSIHALPSWAKGLIIFFLLLLLLFLIAGGAAAPSQPWLVSAAPAASAYFSAGSASAGVINCSSALGVGFFSIGMVSFGLIGSIGIFSVGFFSIGFFSIGIFSVGQVALGVYAWGAYSRWMKKGDGWSGGRKVLMNDIFNFGHLLQEPVEMSDLAQSSVPLAQSSVPLTASSAQLGQSAA